ncbi:MAG: hypothetical protein SOZ59_15375 [Candidatus Limivivens sp.]|nr:hypothetical protein [Candidatus Limivivens sp.]
MRKKLAQITGVVLAVTLVAGITVTNPTTGNLDLLSPVVDTYDDGQVVDEVVIGEEEIPLADKTKVTTTTNTKTTVKTQKMAKAATKSKTTTKKSTKKSTKTLNSSTQTKKKNTTVLTTVKTTVRKKSKIKTIQTTVKTTVTTTTTLKDSSSTVTASNASTGTTASAGTSLRQLGAKADDNVLNAFETMGYTLKFNSSVSYAGVFDARKGYIELRKANSGNLLHELGHFVSFMNGGADSSSDFQQIFASEKRTISSPIQLIHFRTARNILQNPTGITVKIRPSFGKTGL